MEKQIQIIFVKACMWKNGHNGIFQHNFVFSSRQNNSQAHLFCFQMVLNHLLRTYKMNCKLYINSINKWKAVNQLYRLVLHLKNGHWDRHAQEVHVFTRNWESESEIFGQVLFHLMVKWKHKIVTSPCRLSVTVNILYIILLYMEASVTR